MHAVALNIKFKDFANDFGLNQNNLQDAVRSFGITQKLRVVQHGFPAPHTVADAEFEILAAEMVFSLI